MNKYLRNAYENEDKDAYEDTYEDEGLTNEDLKSYNIRVLFLPYLLENWLFDDRITIYIFIHGIDENSLENLVLKDEFLLEYFDVVDEKLYYFIFKNGNSEFLNCSSIPYPDFIAAVVYHYLLLKKKQHGDFFYKNINFDILLDYLFNPLFHNEVLNILKKDIFIPSEFLSSFICAIETTEQGIANLNIVYPLEEKDAKYFYNILTYMGVSHKEALTLTKNCNTKDDLKKIVLYLKNFQNK